MRVVARVKSGKLKHQEPNLPAKRFAGSEERVCKQLSIQEMLVRIPRPMAEAGQIRKFLHRDFIGDLEGELKIRRHQRCQTFEIFLRWKCVICRIDADRLENFGLFAEAIPLKLSFGDLAPVLISRWSIKLS